MALVTGTPLGTITEQDATTFIDKAPSIWFQDFDATILNNPDADGFYWGLTGSATYPVYELECYETVSLTAQVEENAVRCDTVGDVATIQQITSIDLTLTLKTLFPLDTLSKILRGGAVTTTAGATEKFGIGQPNNNQYWRWYGAVVYDDTAGDYVNFTAHRVQFVGGWTLSFEFGNAANLSVTLRAFADTTLPSAQQFMTIIRADPSAIT